MHLDWLLNPATFYSVALVSLLTSVCMFISIKIEIARLRSLAEVKEAVRSGDDTVIRRLKAEIEELRESINRLEESAAETKLSKRAQALRMHRRGEAVTSIAAALETPSNEVALMLKVHELTSQDEKAS
jgi:hypothetical protein